jgi:hypothetical protein
MFYPIGIDLPSTLGSTPHIVPSLNRLAALRGDAAHKSPEAATVIPDPADVDAAISDCLQLASILHDRVVAARRK